jgi:hypothetical protein
MTERHQPDVIAHNQEIGLLCTQWAYLEWLLEQTIWWLLDLTDTPNDARPLTGGLSIENLAQKARDR